MKRQIVISLGYRTEEGMLLLSWWEDYADPKRTRFMRNGHFNVDKWEAAQTHLFMCPGADPRAAWKEAWLWSATISGNAGGRERGLVVLSSATVFSSLVCPAIPLFFPNIQEK